ncbi:hypothetical protein L195_g063484, partial [Trifolium pratense]
ASRCWLPPPRTGVLKWL